MSQAEAKKKPQNKTVCLGALPEFLLTSGKFSLERTSGICKSQKQETVENTVAGISTSDGTGDDRIGRQSVWE